MKRTMIGFISGIVLLIIAMGIVFLLSDGSEKKDQIVVSGPIGGEKAGFLEDEEVKEILKNDYGISINWTKEGSMEMVKKDMEGKDFLFPSSQVAFEFFKDNNSGLIKGEETIFNSPIVIYSWKPIANALIKKGIVQKEDDTYYVVNTEELLDLAVNGENWSSVGLTELYGKVSITTTHPAKSNSGNMFLGLLANMINNGEVVNNEDLDEVLPTVKDYYKKIGYMEHSSGDLFEQYLRTGMGAKPLVIGYENQLVEFVEEHKDVWDTVKEEMIVMYPTPTVWSSHPFIALTDNGKKLMEALEDKEIQKIAWEKHGFRTGVMGIENNPEDLAIGGLPKDITSVIPMPNPDVMEALAEATH